MAGELGELTVLFGLQEHDLLVSSHGNSPPTARSRPLFPRSAASNDPNVTIIVRNDQNATLNGDYDIAEYVNAASLVRSFGVIARSLFSHAAPPLLDVHGDERDASARHRVPGCLREHVEHDSGVHALGHLRD